MVRRYQ